MNILHINGDYPFQALYYELLQHFSEGKGIKHIMYVPLKSGRKFSRKYDISTPNVNVIYSFDFNKLDRLIYYTKKAKILRAIQNIINIADINCVHAHTLFSTGGVAYELKKKLGINYIVAVRNTDLNEFFKYMVHLRNFGIKVMNAASKVIFLSSAYKDIVINKYVPKKLRKDILAKSIVIPNGIADFWHKNRFKRKNAPPKHVELLYIGAIKKNKNIETTIRVTRLLKARGINTHFTMVGGGPNTAKIKKIIGKNDNYIKIHKWIASKEKLIPFYRAAHIFVMPSLRETFGIVFIEALSQGLPLIYTKGHGIDGYFPQGFVGYACNPLDVEEITNRIEHIMANYVEFSRRCTDSIENFSWSKLSRQYESIYSELK